jgi:predicted urease superfamily metal-dependent hydrolase
MGRILLWEKIPEIDLRWHSEIYTDMTYLRTFADPIREVDLHLYEGSELPPWVRGIHPMEFRTFIDYWKWKVEQEDARTPNR